MADRQVVFYACEDIENKPSFDCGAAVAGINGLEDAQWRVLDAGLASDLAVIVDKQPEAPSTPGRLRFLRIRDDKPFKLSLARVLTPIEVAENEAITEFTWALLWPDKYLAGVNMPQAPQLKKLGYYFGVTSGQQTHVVNLFEPDVLKRLKEMRTHGTLRKLQVSGQMSELEKIAEKKALPGFGPFLTAGRAADSLILDVKLGIGRGKPGKYLNDATAQTAEELAQAVDLLESMNVAGLDKDGNRQEINLKHERIGEPIQIDASSSNAQIYLLIEKARSDIEQRISSLTNAARGS